MASHFLRKKEREDTLKIRVICELWKISTYVCVCIKTFITGTNTNTHTEVKILCLEQPR